MIDPLALAAEAEALVRKRTEAPGSAYVDIRREHLAELAAAVKHLEGFGLKLMDERDAARAEVERLRALCCAAEDALEQCANLTRLQESSPGTVAVVGRRVGEIARKLQGRFRAALGGGS